MPLDACAPIWTQGPYPEDARPHLDTPFAELHQCGIAIILYAVPVTKEQHYWPVRSTTSTYGREVACKTKTNKVYGNPTRRFGAQRPVKPDPGDELKWHAGVDLGGKHLDMVVACQSGYVTEIAHFNLGTWAVMIQNDDHGLVFSYNELEKGSWNEFKVARGSRVKAGQPIGRIGEMGKKKSTMLHFEAYQTGTKRTYSWSQDAKRPDALRDPTKYLLHLAKWGA